MADLQGDLITNDRTLDKKGDLTAATLIDHAVISKKEGEDIVSTSPFPKLKPSLG